MGLHRAALCPVTQSAHTPLNTAVATPARPQVMGEDHTGACPVGTSVSHSDFSIHLSPLSTLARLTGVSFLAICSLSTLDPSISPPTTFSPHSNHTIRLTCQGGHTPHPQADQDLSGQRTKSRHDHQAQHGLAPQLQREEVLSVPTGRHLAISQLGSLPVLFPLLGTPRPANSVSVFRSVLAQPITSSGKPSPSPYTR